MQIDIICKYQKRYKVHVLISLSFSVLKVHKCVPFCPSNMNVHVPLSKLERYVTSSMSLNPKDDEQICTGNEHLLSGPHLVALFVRNSNSKRTT